MTEPQNLLAEYVQTGSDAAFRELVARYVSLVYSSAMRLVDGDAHRAEDVAQTVFVDLARMAKTIPQDVMLGGWLHRHTCFVAMNIIRSERRRASREKEAVEMNALQGHSDADFSHVAPLLDEAINELGETDRKAILLRFFEQHDFRSVGEAIGANEDAARMRVTRALDKLQGLLKSRGVTISAGTLCAALSANAVQAVPAGLALAFSSTALAATTFSASIIATTAQALVMTTLQKTLIATALVVATGVGIYEARQVSVLRDEIQTLRQGQAPFDDRFNQLQAQFQKATNQLALAEDENERLRRNISELPKLRGEVARLTKDSRDLAQLKATDQNDPTQVAMKSWLTRVTQLKQRLEELPEQNIPELRLVGEQDWLNAAQGKLETEEDYRRAMSRLRGIAESKVANLLQPALEKYLTENRGKFPTDIGQLQPLFKPPVDAGIFKRYAILPASEARYMKMGGDWIITQTAPIDLEYDTRTVVGPNGHGISGSAWKEDKRIPVDGTAALVSVLNEYKQAHNGNEPSDPLQLQPYLRTSEQKEAFEKILQAIADKKTKESAAAQ